MRKSTKGVELSQEQLRKLRRGDFSFGLRPVIAELEAVHPSGKMSFRSAMRVTESTMRPVQTAPTPHLEDLDAVDQPQESIPATVTRRRAA